MSMIEGWCCKSKGFKIGLLDSMMRMAFSGVGTKVYWVGTAAGCCGGGV
jgi:hypothetical protein